MPAPNVPQWWTYLDDESVQGVQWTAPQINGAVSFPQMNNQQSAIQGGWSMRDAANTSALMGGRKVLPQAQDVSSRQYVTFGTFNYSYHIPRMLSALASGGAMVYLVDGAGSYVGFTLSGFEMLNRGDPITGDGFFCWSPYRSLSGSNNAGWFTIDLTRTPDDQSGVFDFTDVAAYEFHANTNGRDLSSTLEVIFGWFSAHDAPTVVGGEVADPCTVADLAPTRLWDADRRPGGVRYFYRAREIFGGANGTSYSVAIPFRVGDGATPTYFKEQFGSLSFVPSDKAIRAELAAGRNLGTCGPYYENDENVRDNRVTLAAGDTVIFEDFTWSGFDVDGGDYSLSVSGSDTATCEFSRNTFYRAQEVVAGPATFADCIFDACNGVSVTSSTALTDCIIRNSTAGIIVDDVPGDYSTLSATLSDNQGPDLTVGAGGAGTYDLTGLSVPDGYTLKIHNESAEDAVVVQVAEGVVTSTTSAGGTISVQSPPVTFDIVFANWVDGTRYQVFNSTTAVEISNDVVAGGGGFAVSLQRGVDYAPDDVIRLRATHPEKQDIEQVFQPGSVTSQVSSPLAQTDDAIYATFGIDGGTVAKFAADYVNLEIDIIIAQDFTCDEFYAWYKFNSASENGIRLFFGAVNAIDQANFEIDVEKANMFLDNLTAVAIIQNDIRRLSRSDGLYPVRRPTTGGGGIDVRWRPDVLIAETGVSGMTPQESAILMSIPSIKEKTDKIPDRPASSDDFLI